MVHGPKRSFSIKEEHERINVEKVPEKNTNIGNKI